MAIAKMKKLTLLAEQSNKDLLLKAVQELQRVEIVPVSEEDEEAILTQVESESFSRSQGEYDTQLQEVRHALDYLREYIPEPGLMARMRKGPETMTLQELEKSVEQTDIQAWVEKINSKEEQLNELQEERKLLVEQEEYLRKWSSLSFHPSELQSFRMMNAQVGTINSEMITEFTAAAKDAGTIYYEEIYRTNDDAAFLVVGPSEETETINRLLLEFQFTPIDYPFESVPAEELKKNLKLQEELRQRKADLEKELRSYKKAPRDLELAEEYYYNLSQRETAKSLLLNTTNLFVLSGWLEEEKIPNLTRLIEDTVGKDQVAIIEDEVTSADYKSVPIVLKNNSFVEPFETVTEMYSLPQYDEIDPTPLLVPFQILFFGMMSADLGYGLILWAATFAALKMLHLKDGMKKNLKFFHLLSYGVMGFGLIYGSFFGFELPFMLLSIQEDVIPVLLLSVAFGFIQMMVGLVTNGIVKNKQGQRASSYIDGYAWAMILTGILLWVLGSMVFNNSIMSTIGILLAAVNAVGILFVSALASKNKGLGLALGAYNIYGISGYVGDIVSYTRLMALGVSGASIGMAFNMIVGFLPTGARFTVGILLMVALHALNIFLTYLSAYVHTARLQFVEFFGKFYEGGGRPLNPLKTLEKHVSLRSKD